LGISVEVTHFFTKVEVVFLVSSFLWSVGCEDQAFLYRLFFPILFHQVKGTTYPMGFIEVINFGIEPQNIDQRGSADAQKHHLSNLRRGI